MIAAVTIYPRSILSKYLGDGQSSFSICGAGLLGIGGNEGRLTKVKPRVTRWDRINPLTLAKRGKRCRGIPSSRCIPCSFAEMSSWVSWISLVSLLLWVLLTMSVCSLDKVFNFCTKSIKTPVRMGFEDNQWG